MPLILGPTSSAIDAIRRIREAGGIERVTVLVAWARLNGVALFLNALVEDVVKARIVVGMAGAGTSAEALSYLREHCAEVHLFHKHHRQTFHPKVYCFDGPGNPPDMSHLMVGSSNLTGGGLFSNYEASLVSSVRPSSSNEDRETWDSVMAAFDEVTTSPYSERIDDDVRIQVLLDEGYLATEARLRRRGNEDGKSAVKQGVKRAKPEAPPPKLVVPMLPEAPFLFVEPVPAAVFAGDAWVDVVEEPLPLGEPVVAPEPFIADGRFFVRTLTANDVAKIRGDQTGTFEPDLGMTARNSLPGFWGWPARYVFVTRKQKTRLEWAARGRAFSSVMPGGIDVEVMQWVRAARAAAPGQQRSHAAEHRLRIGPQPVFAQVLPPGFGVTSLVIIERLPEDEPHEYRVMLLAAGEPGYEDYSHYLVTTRPEHRFGYGPDEPE